MEYLIATIIALLTVASAFLGYALRAGEVHTLRKAYDAERKLNLLLQDYLFYRNNLPSNVAESKKMAPAMASREVETLPSEKLAPRFAGGPPDLFKMRADYEPETKQRKVA